MPITISFAFEGSLPTFVEACDFNAAHTCWDLPPGATFQNRFPLALNGSLVSMHVTVMWTSSSPAMDKLGVSFHGFTQNTFKQYGHNEGPSPLTLNVGPTELLPGGTQRLGVGVPTTEANGEAATAGTDQSFKVSGTATFVPQR